MKRPAIPPFHVLYTWRTAASCPRGGAVVRSKFSNVTGPEEEEEEELSSRLKAALHYTTGLICQSIGADCERDFSRQAVAAIAETAFRQCDTFAKDLEAFAKHAKRSSVSVEDVKLLARRSTALVSHTHSIRFLLLCVKKQNKKKLQGSLTFVTGSFSKTIKIVPH
uniref:Centromere protein S n=1 Tax=Denticeps clupeoides TaxID=299321 RepID=A0AAY4CWG3_9TELE